eukprot:6214642-Pleurochrysis_carterae.AAC.3
MAVCFSYGIRRLSAKYPSLCVCLGLAGMRSSRQVSTRTARSDAWGSLNLCSWRTIIRFLADCGNSLHAYSQWSRCIDMRLYGSFRVVTPARQFNCKLYHIAVSTYMITMMHGEQHAHTFELDARQYHPLAVCVSVKNMQCLTTRFRRAVIAC